MPAFVIMHRPPTMTSKFTLYVAMAETSEEALAAVEAKYRQEPEDAFEVNGKSLNDAVAVALGLSNGDVRPM